MWSPTLEQKSRIADTLVFMKSGMPAIPENVIAYSVAADWKKSCEDALPGTVEKMKSRWPGTELSDRCAEVWLFPLERYERPKLWEDETLRALVGGLEWKSKTIFLASPSAYGVNLLIDRIEYMFRNPMACCERVEPNYGDYYYTPSMVNCLHTLSTLSHMPSVLSFIEDIVVGRFNCTDFERPVYSKDEQENRFENSYKIFDGINGYLAAPFHEFWKILDQAKKFDYTHFRSCCLALPRLLPSFAFGDAKADEMSPDKLAEEHWRKPHAGSNSLEEKTHQFARDFAWEAAEAFDEKNAELLLNFYGLKGARYLLRACAILEADRSIKKINRVRGYRVPVSDALGLMVRITAFEDHDDPDELLEKLKTFSPRVLKIIQPIGGVAQDQINAALAAVTGAKDFGPVQQLIRTINKSFAGDYSIESNSSDPTRGVLEQEPVRAVFQGYSDDDVRAALDMALKSDGELRPAVMMIQALMGWNVEDIQEKLEKRNQLAVRGYGLLPLQPGEAGRRECLARYLRLRAFAKESSQFGQQRRANERAAVEASLANLANTAGLGDPTRLEWAMEALLAEESQQATEVRSGVYRAWLDASDTAAPVIRFEKDGKTLKSAPAELKKNEGYAELQLLLKNLKSQRTRFRAAFERLCAEGAPITAEDLKGLVKLPIAQELAERLVFRTSSGRYGMFDGAALALSSVGKEPVALEGELTVAHPLDLYEAGQLSQWQKEVVARKIVQPFKQVFRELYVLTPAERETRVFSNRFAGHHLQSRPFSGMLSTRGWKVDNMDGAELNKLFPKAGVKAYIELAEAGHYLTESETVVTDHVAFYPYPRRPYKRDVDPRLPLEEISPRILSEVLRDMDLFVSVAQVAEGDATYYSSEAFVRRGELLRSILDDLGLPGVRVEGHFAYVKGKRAQYRVHLGSAVIHIEPGNYLCIVPDHAAKKKDLFLPFADEDDPKLSEVVSKVILLVNDDKIKDESILSQIRRS